MRQLHAEELARRDRERAEAAARRDEERREWRRQSEEAQHANEQATLQRAAAEETLRQNLAQLEARLQTALEELMAEREVASRAQGVVQQQLADLRQVHAGELARLRSDHAQAEGALEHANAREKREGIAAAALKAEHERATAEVGQLTSELTQQALWHSRAMERHGLEVDRLRGELQRGCEEVSSLRAQADGAELRAQEHAEERLRAARLELLQEQANAELRCQQAVESLRQAHAEELSGHELEQRNLRIAGELREATEEQQRLRARCTAEEEAARRRLAALASELRASEQECLHERELVYKSEYALNEVRSAHADELARVAEDLGREGTESAEALLERDTEIRRLRSSAEEHARTVAAWERRLAEADRDHSASLEYAARVQMDADLAAKSLQECRHELAAEQKGVQGLQARARAAAAELDRVRASAAAAELAAEARRSQALQVQVEHREQQEVEAKAAVAEAAGLRYEYEEAQAELLVSERTWCGVVRSLEAQVAALSNRG